jgi:hypothetical protein
VHFARLSVGLGRGILKASRDKNAWRSWRSVSLGMYRGVYLGTYSRSSCVPRTVGSQSVLEKLVQHPLFSFLFFPSVWG